jgi:transposase
MSKKTLSLDLRECVVAAVFSGMSRRQAAARFGVSAASAIRWCRRQNETGSPASFTRGGDRWSARIDAHKSLILSLVEETCGITLKELQA